MFKELIKGLKLQHRWGTILRPNTAQIFKGLKLLISVLLYFQYFFVSETDTKILEAGA